MGARDYVVKTVFKAVDKVSKTLGKMQTRINRFANRAQKSLKKMSRIAMRAAVPIGLLGAAAVKSALDINKAMASVGTLIPKQTKLLETYKKGVMDLAAETGVASTVIAEGLYETISAFGNEADTMDKLTIATKMSKAGMADVKESLALVSAVTKGYGDQTAKAVQNASDLAFLTVKLGQTTFPELAASMGKVVPLATTLKVSQEELFGAMATLTGVTGTAAEGATQLGSALGAFIKPSAAMTRAAKKMGYASSVAMLKEEGLADSLKKLGDYAGMDEIELGKLLTRKEGLNAALTLLGPQAENFAKKTLAMADAAGATDEAYKAQTEGINKSGHAMAQATEKIKNMAIKIGDKLLPVIVRIIDKATPWIDKFLKADDATLELGIKIAGLVAAIGPLLKVLDLTIGSFKTVINVVGKTKGAMGVLGAFVAGWQIGDAIREKLVDPLIEAQFQLQELVNDVADTMGRDVSKRGSAQLKKDLEAVEKTRKALDKDVVLSNLPGMGFFKDMGTLGLNKEEGRLKGALAAAGPSPTRPKVDISKTSSESMERSEVTIKDETGRAKQTKGKEGRGFKLVHSGAMP